MSELPAGLAPNDAYDVVSAAGNHEVKGLVLGVMEAGVPYTVKPLYDDFMALQVPGNPAWKVHTNTPHAFCKTFAGVGLVAKETVGANGALGFAITEKGIRCRPPIGHLLDLSLGHEPSLVGFFGPAQTNSSEHHRASGRRIGLMRLLLATNGKRTAVADVASALDVSIHKAGRIAEDLEVHDIVGYESSGRGKPTIRFMATPSLQGMEVRRNTGSQILFDIVDLLKGYFREHPNGSLSNEDIAKILIDSRGYVQPLSELIREVNKRTTHFANTRKVLSPSRQVEPKKARSVVWASAAQLAVIAAALDAVNGIQTPTKSYIDSGLDKLEVITSNPETVNYLVHKAKADSIGRKGKDEEQQRVQAQMTAMFATATTPLSVSEMQHQLREGGDNFDRDTVRYHIKLLVTLGQLTSIETAQGNKYVRVQ